MKIFTIPLIKMRDQSAPEESKEAGSALLYYDDTQKVIMVSYDGADFVPLASGSGSDSSVEEHAELTSGIHGITEFASTVLDDNSASEINLKFNF